ncbi:MAG: hypothetical protein Q7J09_06340 [Methanocalculus sp.]|uniref:hypothetical protein n=1 Tax=Methanocalculus sp. TaxID=2004547 RepID=UPI0027268672|nr:hypothetical protein [Methanocalculus sp.]MDO9539605.1 hypothetical protein [Methanocalculus sp.]
MRIALVTITLLLLIPSTMGAMGTEFYSVTTKGESISIRGHAWGSPDEGVAIWIFGQNYYQRATQSVGHDSGFTYELPGSSTALMGFGTYFVVVQHPGGNNRFDVIEDTTTTIGTTYVRLRGSTTTSGADVFTAQGPGRLQGSVAATALTRLLENQNIDDMYMTMTLLIEEPWIRVEPASENDGDAWICISGVTNLAPGSTLLIEIRSSSFQPTIKSSPAGFSGVSGAVEVHAGEGGYNTFSYKFEAAILPPDEYSVVIESIETGRIATSTFTIVADTSVPEPTVTVSPVPSLPVDVPETPTTPEPQKVPLLYAPFAALVAGIYRMTYKRR